MQELDGYFDMKLLIIDMMPKGFKWLITTLHQIPWIAFSDIGEPFFWAHNITHINLYLKNSAYLEMCLKIKL